MAKTFFIPQEQIERLIDSHEGCIASDRITVDGESVGYLYREEPDEDTEWADSGWRFMAGDETQEYVDDSDNLDLYEVNTIANYSPDIIAVLDAPYGSSFYRDDEGTLLPDDEA